MRRDSEDILLIMDKAIDESQEIIKKLVEKVLKGVSKEIVINDLLLMSKKLDMENTGAERIVNDNFKIGEYVNIQLPERFGYFYGVITQKKRYDLFDCILIAGPDKFGQIIEDVPRSNIKR